MQGGVEPPVEGSPETSPQASDCQRRAPGFVIPEAAISESPEPQGQRSSKNKKEDRESPLRETCPEVVSGCLSTSVVIGHVLDSAVEPL